MAPPSLPKRYTLSRFEAALALFLAALIFGSTFVAQKAISKEMPPLFFVATRFLISALLVAPLAWRERQKSSTPITKDQSILALLTGGCLFVGNGLQQIAVSSMSVTDSGFLTALYAIFVPFAVWVLTGKLPRQLAVVCCLLSVFGAYLMNRSHQVLWTFSDGLSLAADIGWAFQAALISIFLSKTTRPFYLCVVQYVTVCILSFAFSIFFEHISLSAARDSFLSILYAGAMAGGVAFTLQTVALSRSQPTEASIILSMEGVFAALFGAYFNGDRLSPSGIWGATLIITSVMLIELAPKLTRKWAAYKKGY